MKKRIIALIFVLAALMFALCSCAAENGEAADNSADKNTANDNAADKNEGGEGVNADEDFDYSAYLDSNGYFKDFKVSDIVTLPKYKGVTIPAEILTADPAEVEAEIANFVANAQPTYEKVYDRAIVDGDTLNIDYVGSVDGVEFEGGTTGGRGTTVTIGVTNYIDDFLQQLIGHKPGESFDIEVTFPENYGVEDLNGKDAVFNITVNYIQGEELPREMNDELAQSYGYTSADALKLAVELYLVDKQKQAFFDEIVSSATCGDIPEEIIDYVSDALIAEFKMYAQYYGTDIETLLTANGYESTDALIEANMDTILASARSYIIIQAIAEAEGITVSDEYIYEHAGLDQAEAYGLPYMKQYFLAEHVRDFVFDNAA